ncbi:MAG: hypothetical protein KA527_01235 [Cytophagaceae bacterium]|nr:hypothetical protein [Cytophagaceae bacterium]MBP6093040.1 hypothetical protein [Cytophagaceae bacterium]
MKKLLAIVVLVLVIVPKGKLLAQTGIGTTAPVNKFQVEGAAADPATSGATANGILRLSGTTGIHVLDMGVSYSATYAWIQARSESAYGTNYNLILNPNGGFVGIGTTTPSAKLNLAGGGIRIHNGFSNSTSRPALNAGTIGNYEIRGVGSGGGTTQSDSGDDGFLRLSAGGGTSTTAQASIDISGYSSTADMNSNIVMRTSGVERFRISDVGTTTVTGNLTGTSGTSTLANFGTVMNDQTGTSYTLAASDNGKVITFNSSSAITLTVPSLSVGFNCMVVQKGTGQVTLSASGVTISNRYGYTKTAGQYSMFTLVCIASNVYISSGDMNN